MSTKHESADLLSYRERQFIEKKKIIKSEHATKIRSLYHEKDEERMKTFQKIDGNIQELA